MGVITVPQSHLLARITRITAVLTLLPGALLAQTGRDGTQGAGGLVASGPKFQVVRSVAGTSGSEKDGKLVIDNPQTIFHIGQDHKVIVYFEWLGPLGPHKFEGMWKNPDGKVVMIAEFQYSATAKQFAGYWTMLLSGSETPGIWSLDARIDGEAAGSFPFQLVTEPGADMPPPAPTPARQPLEPAALYQHAVAATVYVDKFDGRGKIVGHGSGFYLDDGRLLTAFQNIDGAKQVRVVSADGRSAEVTQVLMWNRWQDWAILAVEGTKAIALARAEAKTWTIGTPCFYLEVSAGSSRVITSTSIVGQNTFPRAGERLNLSASPDRAAVGSPLLNEFGEVIGMIGGSLAPGTNLLESYLLSESGAGSGGILRYGLAVPITLVPAASARPTPVTFDQLAQAGQMIPVVTAGDRVEFGELATTLDKGKGIPGLRNSRQQFSHRDAKIYVYINWDPNTKFKGVATMAIYDVDNHPLSESKPLKVNLHPGDLTAGIWELNLAVLPSGTYRVDVALGGELVWRRFFRLGD
jgi:S1-C subfamily serine protease